MPRSERDIQSVRGNTRYNGPRGARRHEREHSVECNAPPFFRFHNPLPRADAASCRLPSRATPLFLRNSIFPGDAAVTAHRHGKHGETTRQHTSPMSPTPLRRTSPALQRNYSPVLGPGYARGDACESGRFAVERNFIPPDNWILRGRRLRGIVLGIRPPSVLPPAPSSIPPRCLGIPWFLARFARKPPRLLRGSHVNSDILTLIVFRVDFVILTRYLASGKRKRIEVFSIKVKWSAGILEWK